MYFPQPRLVQGISESGSCSPLPTPTAADGERGGRGDVIAIVRGKPNKHTRWLPTPLVNDAQKRGTAYLFEHREGTTFGNNLPRSIAAEILPTPTGRSHKDTACEPNLSFHIKQLLPTPTARDYKDTPGMKMDAGGGRVRDDQLPRRIYVDESSRPNPQNPLGGMKLTPEFQCWLMGYAINWLKPLLVAPETQSSRKPSSRLPKQSKKP